MIRKLNRISLALAATLLCLATHMAVAGNPAQLSLGMEHFRDTASIAEDLAAGSVTLSTEPGFIEYRGPLRTVWNDQFLRATLDLSGERKSFEIDVTLTYSGTRRWYRRATYRTSSGPQEAAASLVRVETTNCAIECIYTEHLVFPIEEQTLRQIAASYAPGKTALWTFKLLAKAGPSYQGEISNAEIAGLLARVDGYHPPVAGQEVAAPAPRPLDFGISGLAVAASAEMPARAGVLVAGVTPGSVAHKTGIIVGDIIFSFGAHPIKTPADLQAAMAASGGSAAVPIKVFRGTAPLSLEARF
jgi:membrane-associated protease RseP (regulator of RpoE activity)